MSYIALARRYRPQSFADVTAQTHITDTLRQAIAGGRVAQAYLFTGPRGSGKTTVARILAKAVNCDKPKDGEPDGVCEPCVSITDARSMDVIEIDGASNNSVDDVRELRESVRYAPSQPGKRKVYIVDEVHMLSGGAFNALLKTLEEPPPHVVFVFATTEPRKVPDTIRSRCQRFDFRRLLIAEIRSRLEYICKREKIAIDPEAIFVLARRADGSLRDALSLLDQIVSSTSGKITEANVAEILGIVREEAYLELATAILDRDAVHSLGVVHSVLAQGADPATFALGLVEHLRNLMLLGLDRTLRSAVPMGDAHLAAAEVLAARFKTEDLLYLLNRAAALFEETRHSGQPVVVLEAAVVEMARFDSRVVLSELLERLDGGPGGPGGPDDASPGPRGSTTGAAGRVAPAAGPARRPSGPRAEADSDSDADREMAASPLVPPTAPRLVSEPAGDAVAAYFATSSAADSMAATVAPPPPAPARASDVIAAGGPLPGRSTAPSARIDFETVVARWTEFTAALRGSKAMLAHCLSEGRPVRLSAGVLEVWFPPEHTFHSHLFEEAVKRRDLEPYLAQFFGTPLKTALALEEHAAAPRPAAARRRETPPNTAPGSPAGNEVPAAGAAMLDESGSQRLTSDDIARGRRDAIEDVIQRTPVIDDVITAFDCEVLEDPQ